MLIVQQNLLAVPLLIGAPIFITLALVAWTRNTALASRLFLVFTFTVALYMFGYAVELMLVDLAPILRTVQVQHTAIAMIAPLWALFIIAYTGHERWLNHPAIGLLFVAPVLHVALVWTTPQHDLFYTYIGTTLHNGLIYFDRVYGVGFWLSMAFFYGLLLVATLVMLVSIVRQPLLYRAQIVPLLVAMVLPWVANVLTVVPSLNPLPYVDLLPYGLALGVLPFAWSLYRHQLFDLVPTAYSQVVESLRDPVIVLDGRRRIVALNTAAVQLTGKAGADLRGRSLADIFPGNRYLIDRYGSLHEANDEITLGTADQQRYFELRMTPLWQRGQMSGYVLVLRDVSRWRWLEILLRRYADELEQRNRELDGFSRHVAHDLRTPLSLIRGYVELSLLEADHLPPAIEKNLHTIEGAVVKMNDMISNLLLLARLRDPSGHIEPVDMNAVARAALSRFQLDIDARAIHVDVAADLPPAFGQAGWLEEVFANLISNAIKYMGQDNPQPYIRVRGALLDGRTARYEVSDTGLGITPANRERLFELFARFHEREADGMGIGLALVLGIVTRLNGTVGVESEPGVGSTFWFTLRAAPPDDPVTPAAASLGVQVG